jgi:class 3 adenylate cyclase
MKMTPIILIIFSIPFLLSCQSDDINQTQFMMKADEKILPLNGTWKFKQGDNPGWASPDLDDSNWKTHPVPGSWTRNDFTGKGISWYRTWIDVPEHMNSAKHWALETGRIISAAEIYWDGNLLVRYGKVSDSKDTETPGKSDYLFLIPQINKTAGRHLISIRTSNFHSYSGSILGVPVFGSYKQLFIHHETRIVWMSILIGLFLLSGIVHLVLFILNRSRSEYLYIALMSFSESYFIVLSEMWGLHEMDFDYRFRLVHCLLLSVAVLLYLVLTKQFEFKNRWLKYIVLGVSGVFFLTLVLPHELAVSEFLSESRLRWSQIVQVVGIFVIFWAMRKRIMGSKIALIGVLPLAFGNIYAVRVLDDIWVHAGFAFFTIMIAIGAAIKVRTIEEEVRESRDVFRRFVPDPILNKIAMKGLGSIKLGGAEETHSTILFADIRGFTTIAEKLTPNETLNFLNTFMQSMQPLINQKGGFINQFVGDEIMAIFHEAGHGDAAVDTAIKMGQVLQEYNSTRVEKGKPEIKIGIGVNTGKVIWGTIGSESRMESAIIGDTVNLTSRLQSLTKQYQVDILISDSTYRQLKNPSGICHRQADIVQVKGKTEPVTIYEFFENDAESIRTQKMDSRDDYEKGLEHHYKRNWPNAIKCFEKCLQICPDDPIASIYIQRCQEYIKDPSIASHEGITVLKEK